MIGRIILRVRYYVCHLFTNRNVLHEIDAGVDSDYFKVAHGDGMGFSPRCLWASEIITGPFHSMALVCCPLCPPWALWALRAPE